MRVGRGRKTTEVGGKKGEGGGMHVIESIGTRGEENDGERKNEEGEGGGQGREKIGSGVWGERVGVDVHLPPPCAPDYVLSKRDGYAPQGKKAPNGRTWSWTSRAASARGGRERANGVRVKRGLGRGGP